jgi:predicted Zn-dependent protease
MANKQKHLCPCGSGKRAKVCCREVSRNAKLAMTPSIKLEMRRTVESLAKEGRHSEASEILEKLVALSPRNPLIWNDLGVQYEAAGQIDKAFTALKRGHAIDSTYPPTLYNLGKFTLDYFVRLHETGYATKDSHKMLVEAIRFLNAYLDRDPENADGHYNLALAYGLNQNEDRALVHAEIALKLKGPSKAPLLWMKKPRGWFDFR